MLGSGVGIKENLDCDEVWGGVGGGWGGAEMDTGTKLSDEAVTTMFCVDLMSLNDLNFQSVLLIKEADRYKWAEINLFNRFPMVQPRGKSNDVPLVNFL